MHNPFHTDPRVRWATSIENADGGHAIRLHAARHVNLHPNAFLPRDAVLLIVPALKAAGRKASRVDGEVVFDRAKDLANREAMAKEKRDRLKKEEDEEAKNKKEKKEAKND